ncbi:MAG: hypothetical protein RML40_02600 [Bacteroidota bacterium]|nr:hypothetical protein [Candidatus Kapabacteria bacterium]MDW8219400.1 hypothetical protein [Bacteroidota bacterium]
MQTSLPTVPSSRVLTVLARLLPEGVPLPGVIVEITDERTGAQIAASQTNSEGAATVRLENVPALGSNILIRARRSSQEQRVSILLCNDTTVTVLFSNQAAATASCARLSGVDSLRFRTNTIPSSDSLIQNEPSGIVQYERCWSFVNTGNDSIRVSIPFQQVSPPFQLLSVSINNRVRNPQVESLVIPPAGTLSLCFSVSTVRSGDFTQEVPLSLQCQTTGEQGMYRLRLRALVVERKCECISSEFIVNIAERVPIGSTRELSNLAVYTNQLSCPVAVNILGIRTTQSSQQAEWELLEPSLGVLPQVLQVGERLTVRLRFRPRSVVSQPERLLIELRPQGAQQVCTLSIRLNGLACRNDCPILQTQSANIAFVPLPAVPSGTQESLTTRLDGSVFVAVPDLGMVAPVVRTYAIMNPATSCSISEVNIVTTFSDVYSSRFFTVSPTLLRLAPGETGFFQVRFVPPDAATFAMILNDPMRRTGTAEDSSFSVSIQLRSETCSQRLQVRARVSTIPDISPIINLRAYRQRTRLKPQEENEVYIFGEQSRRILRVPGSTSGIFPPPQGDIFVDVMNNDSSAVPPQLPTLNIVPRSRVTGVALWRASYPEQDFDNVAQTFRLYMSAPLGSFSMLPVNPQPGQVYAFRIGLGSVALLYVRRVDNGTEMNTNGQSGVEFRAIYPVLLR